MSYLAEQGVIGSLLIDKNSMDEIYNMLAPEMFTSELHGRIFLEFLRGYDNHYEVNQVVLCQKLQVENFPQALILEEIKNCTVSTITSASVKSYAQVVVSDFKARMLNKLIGMIKVSPNNINEQIGAIINDLEALQEGKQSASKALPDIVRENKNKYFCDNEEEKIYLGFPKLDDLLGGLEGGDVIIIGARPAVGKSAFVTQITASLADKGKRVGFYNLEMQEKQVYERFVVSQSGIGLTRLRRAVKFLEDEKERFDKANEVLEKQDNIAITTGSKAVSEIRSESRHMGYDVIIIDYLQLLKADKQYRGNRYAEVGAISRAIKGLAMELNIPIIVLSQLNRVSEMKDTKEPTMAELRESGDIEQDASAILLMWNLLQEDSSKKGCKVEKNRQGVTGKVVLKFNGDIMRFEETGESPDEVRAWERIKDDDCPFR